MINTLKMIGGKVIQCKILYQIILGGERRGGQEVNERFERKINIRFVFRLRCVILVEDGSKLFRDEECENAYSFFKIFY